MYTFVLVIHVIVSILLMIVILLQDGSGGDVVSALGGGGAQSVFGGTGAAPFLTKATVVLTVIFAVTSLSLAVLKTRERKSILQSINPSVTVNQPVELKKNEKAKPPVSQKGNVEVKKDKIKQNEKSTSSAAVKVDTQSTDRARSVETKVKDGKDKVKSEKKVIKEEKNSKKGQSSKEKK